MEESEADLQDIFAIEMWEEKGDVFQLDEERECGLMESDEILRRA